MFIRLAQYSHPLIMKITTKLTLAIILCAFFVPSVQAQADKEDLVITYSHIGKGDSENLAKIAFNKFELKANLYRKFTKKGALYFHSANYASININYSKELGIATELEHFHSLSYAIGASIPLKNNWRLTGVFSPTLASNFEGDIEFEDFQFLGLFFFGKAINKSKNLYLNIGAMYSNTLGVPTPLPYFSLTWTPNKKFKYEFGFPNTGVTYKANKKLSFGSKLFISGENLRLGHNLVHQEQKTVIDNIKLTNFGWGLEGKMKFNKHISLRLSGGYTFSRQFKFNKGNTEVRNFSLDNNFFARAGFSIAF